MNEPLSDADEMLPPHSSVPAGGRTGNVRPTTAELTAQVRSMIDGNGADGEQLAKRAQALADQIVEWWERVSRTDAAAAAAKSTEYGGAGAALDLVWLGEQLTDMRTGVGGFADPQAAIELGIFFYLLGKMARWKAAILEGRAVSDDTIKDIHTYAMMARYNREHGSWP